MSARSRSQRLRRRVAALIAALGIAALLGSAVSVGTTEASWVDSERGGAMFTAGTLGAPVPNSCVRAGTTFTPRWSTPASPSVAPTEYQYRLHWTALLLGVRREVTEGWTSVDLSNQFSYTLPTTLLQAGTYDFEVRSVSGAWASAPITGSALVITLLGGGVAISGCSWS